MATNLFSDKYFPPQNGLHFSISSQSILGVISCSRPRKKRRKKHRRKRGEKESKVSESVGVTRVPEQDTGECLSSSLIQVRPNYL